MKRLNKKGFTLVELLAVIVVLALLMVVAAGSIGSALDNSKKSALESETKKLITNLTTEAKSYAITGTLNATSVASIQSKYSGTDGDYTYTAVLNDDGSIASIQVCYLDDYMYDLTDGKFDTGETLIKNGDKDEDGNKISISCTGGVTLAE